MTKKIEFETVSLFNECSPVNVRLLVINEGQPMLCVRDESVWLSEAESWRRLAKAASDMANAIEASKRVTFGELEVGAFFRMNCDVWVKTGDEFARTVTGTGRTFVCEDDSVPVTRVKATFEDVE